MALASIIHKEVDATRDPRLDFPRSGSLHSLDKDTSGRGLLDEGTKQLALSDTKKYKDVKYGLHGLLPSATAKGRQAPRKKSSNTAGNDRVHEHCTAGVSEQNGLNGAFESMDKHGQGSVRKEPNHLQLQKTTASKKPSGPHLQTKSSKQHSRMKEKEDLDEILRKRLEKLEAELDMIQTEHSVPDTDAVAMATKETHVDGGKRYTNSRVGKRRKVQGESDDGDDRYASRIRINSDDTERIIAANIGETATNSAKAKLERNISAILKNEAGPNEGLSLMSADFSDEIMSVIQSNFGGNFHASDVFSEPTAEDMDLVDTETIMLNVLSQNLPDTSSSHPPATGILPEVIDNDVAIMPRESLQPKPEGTGNRSEVESPKEGIHIGCLSVDTQWDSQFVESSTVKSTHLNAARDWRSKKLLDLLISGRLKEIPSGTSSEIQHEGTDIMVSSSLQNILNSLYTLCNAAVGDSVHDVISNTTHNLDSLMDEFAERSGCADIPASMRLDNDQMADDVTDTEVAAEQDTDKQDDWLDVECQLLAGLASSLDDAREKVLEEKHSGETIDPDIPNDMYSPTRPTEVDLASSGGAVGVRRPERPRQTETGDELQVEQSTDVTVTDTLNELVENSAPSRRTVRIHKKENAAVKSSNVSIKKAVHKGRHRNATSKLEGLPISEEHLENTSFQMLDTGFARNKTVSSINEIEMATDGLRSKQTATGKQAPDRKSVSVTGKFYLSDENRYGMDSSPVPVPVVSQKAKSSRKRSSGHDDVPDKLRSLPTDGKKNRHSHKHKERLVDVTGRKNQKKTRRDIERSVERQLKLDVRSELNNLQKIIESLLYDEYGITTENANGMSDAVSLYAAGNHFPILSDSSGLTADESNSDEMLNAVNLSPLLDDILTELNIPLITIQLTLPVNASNEGLAGQMSSVQLSREKKSEVEAPSSPPTMRRVKKQSGVSQRKKTNSEADVSVIPHRRQEPVVSENETRLMKADRLMQTFRRSQIAKRQSKKSSPPPPTAFIRQVQTVIPAEELKPAESETVLSSSEAKEPDFSRMITDGTILAAVELPQIMQPDSLLPDNETTASIASHASSPKVLHAAETETVHINTPSVAPSAAALSSSVDHKTVSVVSSANKEQRVFVFSSHKPLCREIQETLIAVNGARLFDPYNVVLLRAYNQLDCHVLINSAEVADIHQVPNLLRLKRDLRVSFVVFDNLEDVTCGTLRLILPRGGLVIIDTGTLIGCTSEILGSICEFMLKQSKDRNVPWLLMIANNCVEELHRLRTEDSASAIEYSRKAAILAQFQASGVIQTLPVEFSRLQRRRQSVDDYLQCFVTVQSQFLFKHRHFLFVSGMSRTHSDAQGFVARGVDVLSVPEFVRGFVGQPVTAELTTHPEYTVEHTPDVYSDVALSDGAESVMNRWIPPTAVTAPC